MCVWCHIRILLGLVWVAFLLHQHSEPHIASHVQSQTSPASNLHALRILLKTATLILFCFLFCFCFQFIIPVVSVM